MNGWERLQEIDISWLGYAALVALVALLVLRRTLPAERKTNTTASILFLLAAFTLHVLGAIGATFGLGNTWPILNLVTVLLLAIGVTGLFNVLAFDVVFGRTHAPSIMRDLVQGVMLFGLLLYALRRSGVDPFSLVTTSAVVTAVIGLALQTTIANLFAGLALPMERTFGIGDWVQVGNRTGRIREIMWRATALVTKDGDTLIVPNSTLLSGEVLNYSKPTGAHRMWLRIGFHYRHPPNEVRRVLVRAVRHAPDVLSAPEPDCFPVEFGESAVIYALRYWITDFERSEPIAGEVSARVWYAAHRAGLEIPFPIRTIVNASVTPDHAAAQEEKEWAERQTALAHVDLFSGIEETDRAMLAQAMRRVHFAAGEEIIRQGEPGDSLYLVHSGEIAVSLSVDGERRDVAVLKPGDFFGERSLVTGEPRNASCVALIDAICFVVDHKMLRHLLDAKPKVAEELTAILVRRQMALDGQREGLSAEARTRREAEEKRNLLERVRGFFGIN